MSKVLLHKTKLDDFKAYLDRNNIPHRPGRGAYQILQVLTQRDSWQIVYNRENSPEHYTVTWPLEHLVRRYIHDRNRKD